MRIGIITLWDSMNYGAFLQAFALSQYCKQRGADVYFLDFNKEFHKFISFRSVKKSLNGLILFNKYKSNKKKHFKLGSKRFEYDYIIVGSDELWNLKNSSFYHYDEYFGKDLHCKKIITYAVSANDANIDLFKELPFHPFEIFDSISVRDYSTKKIVEMFNRSAQIVLDPTFLLDDYNNWIIPFSFKHNYLLIYGYNFSKEEILIIKKYASNKGLVTVSAGIVHEWCDFSFPLCPFQFLGAIKNSERVITSTFHGTVFSLILRKQLTSIARNNSKIIELLDMFDLKNVYTNNNNELDNKLNSIIDYAKLESSLKEKIMVSQNFLNNEVGF